MVSAVGRLHRTRVAVALATVFLAAAPLFSDTWYEAYDKAEQALDGERWAEAVGHLNAALAEQPQSSRRMRTYGMRFIAYHPFLKLGIAYYHLGQVDAALQAFETEERQGVIGQSGDEGALLASYRKRILDERAAEATVRQDRAQSVIAESLEAARRLESEGQIEDALAALGNALAVTPDHADALAMRTRLLAAAARRAQQREDEARFASRLDRGEQALAGGRFAEAAASFTEALAVRDDDNTRALLAQAQERLRSTIDERPVADDTPRRIAGVLERAAALERAGDLDATLAALQEAFALDPQHGEARAMERRVVRLAREAEAATARQDQVGTLLTQVEDDVLAGDYEQALRTANRVLGIEPANEVALRQIARVYARLSDILLAADSGPPAIVLDQRRNQDDDRPLIIRTSELVLTGRVYDSTPVELIIQAAGQPIGRTTIEGRDFQGVWVTDFRWQHRLPAGESTLDVVAIDRDGNRAEMPFAVIYAVPFVRSFWFPALVVAILAAVAGAFLFVRLRRRRQLLRGRFNPYTAGAPILEQTRFFGRQQLLDYVLRRIGNNSVMLYGERRIGKTSFQHRLKRCLLELDDPDHAFFPVYIDLQGTPQERFFATLAAEVLHELAPKLEGMQAELPPGQESYGYRDLVKDLHRVLKALKTRTRKKVKLVLLIDEVDELNDYDPRVNQRLRSLFMRAFAENLVSVVSGVSIKKHWEREGSPWYNFFQEIEVKPLDPLEARSLIEAPVRGIFSFEDGAAAEIVRRTDSKPYLIQRLCTALVDRLHEERRKKIILDDVEAACQIEGL